MQLNTEYICDILIMLTKLHAFAYLYGAVEKTIVLPGTIEKAFRAGKTAVVLPMWRLLESLSFRLISMVALSGLQVTGKVHCVLGRSLLLQPHCRSHADELEWYHLETFVTNAYIRNGPASREKCFNIL